MKLCKKKPLPKRKVRPIRKGLGGLVIPIAEGLAEVAGAAGTAYGLYLALPYIYDLGKYAINRLRSGAENIASGIQELIDYSPSYTPAPAYNDEGYAISYPDATSVERPIIIETIPYNDSEVAVEEYPSTDSKVDVETIPYNDSEFAVEKYPSTGISYRRPSGFGEIAFPVALGSTVVFSIGDVLRRGRQWLEEKIDEAIEETETEETETGETETKQQGASATKETETKQQKNQDQNPEENPWYNWRNYFNPKKKLFWRTTAPLFGGSLLDKLIEPEGKWYHRITFFPRLGAEGMNWLFSSNSGFTPIFMYTGETPVDSTKVGNVTSADSTKVGNVTLNSTNVGNETPDSTNVGNEARDSIKNPAASGDGEGLLNLDSILNEKGIVSSDSTKNK